MRILSPWLVPAIAASAAAQTVNIAPSGTATMSAPIPGFTTAASFGIDGNRDGYWWHNSCVCTSNAPGSWWQVALPAPSSMHELLLFNRADCCQGRLANFRIEAKLAGATVWAEDFYATGTFHVWLGPLRVLLADGITADTVRIQSLGPNAEGTHYLQFAELEILRHGPLRETNLGPMSTGAQSSFYVSSSSHPAMAIDAIDGNTNGHDNANSIARTLNGPGQWLRFDIPPGPVHELRLWPPTASIWGPGGNFRVAVRSGTTEVWGQTLFASTFMPGDLPTYVTPPAGTAGDNVYIHTLGPVLAWEMLAFAEVEIIRFGNDVADQHWYDQGCEGSVGLAVLSSRDRPGLGSTFTSRLSSSMVGNTLGVLAVGLSHTQWGVLPLPLPLWPIGAPGCKALTSADLLLTGTLVGGDVVFQFPLPTSASLTGVPIYEQGLIFDAAGNPFGAITTNGIRLILGN